MGYFADFLAAGLAFATAGVTVFFTAVARLAIGFTAFGLTAFAAVFTALAVAAFATGFFAAGFAIVGAFAFPVLLARLAAAAVFPAGAFVLGVMNISPMK